MNDILEQLCANWLMFQEGQQNATNFYITLAPAYQVRDHIWLNTRNIRTQRHSKKLDDKLIDSFPVQELIGKRTYKLELPTTLQIHPVFYVSLSYPIFKDLVSGQVNQQTGPIIGTNVDNSDIYEVESIIDSYSLWGQQKFKYLVKWKSWPHEFNTKKLVKHLTNWEEVI